MPCPNCGRAIRRTARGSPRKIYCPRCRYLIYDYPRSCAGMIVVRDGKVLVLRRGHAPRRGCLDTPGGFMDAGESIEAAARRELREETGLTVGPVELLGFYWDRYYLRGFGWFPTMNWYYLALWRSGTPKAADDAASVEWVPIESLGRPGQRIAFQHTHAMFRDLKRLWRAARRATR